MEEFKVRLREAMEARDMKAIELAAKVGVTRSLMSRYLSGEIEPKTMTTYKIAQALDVQEAYLIGYDVPMDRPKFTYDSDTGKIVQQIFDNPNLRLLFSVGKNASADSLLKAAEYLMELKVKEEN